MLLCASSPYARRGALFDAWRKHFGKDGDQVLVWHAPTRDINPTVPQRVIDEAMERDPASAAAEYGAEFRSDIEGFVSRDAIEACVSHGVRERAPVPDTHYAAFVDPSGGQRRYFHAGDRPPAGIRRHCRCRARASSAVLPESVVAEFVDLLKRYRIGAVTGDRYARRMAARGVPQMGIQYELSARPKRDLYRDFLPLVNSGQVELLDHPAQRCAALFPGAPHRAWRPRFD